MATNEKETIPLITDPQREEDGPRKRLFCGITVSKSTWDELVIVFLMIMVIVCGSCNRVTYKIMSVPMKNYSFFLSFFNSVMYAAGYYHI